MSLSVPWSTRPPSLGWEGRVGSARDLCRCLRQGRPGLSCILGIPPLEIARWQSSHANAPDLGDGIYEEMLPSGHELATAAWRTSEQVGNPFSSRRRGLSVHRSRHHTGPPIRARYDAAAAVLSDRCSWLRLRSTRVTITLPSSASTNTQSNDKQDRLVAIQLNVSSRLRRAGIWVARTHSEKPSHSRVKRQLAIESG